MIRKMLQQSLRVPLTFKNRATIFNGEFDPSKDYYLILGVSQKAEDPDIKRAYYKLARIHHPDHNANKSDAKFKEINQAYEVLSDVRKRQNYDSSRTFGDFARGFGQKFQSGNVNSETFNNPFQNMSYEDQQKIIQRGRVLILRAGFILLGFFVIWSLITRKPHRVYEVVNGELIPVDPRAMNSFNQFQQGGYQQQYYPQQQQYPQHLQPQPQYQQPSNNYGSPYNYTPHQQQQQYPTQPGYAPSAYAPYPK